MLAFFSIVTWCITASSGQFQARPQVDIKFPVKHFLKVSGNDLTFKGEKVFLSGMNIAWFAYGYDFGNDHYNCSTIPQYLNELPSGLSGSSCKYFLKQMVLYIILEISHKYHTTLVIEEKKRS